MAWHRNRPSPPPPPLTADQRAKILEELAAKFNRHLLATPGAVLTPQLRWAVAASARDALLRCCDADHKGGCASLPQHTCIRPGTEYQVIADLQHCDFPLPTMKSNKNGGQEIVGGDSEAAVDEEVAKVLTNLVHTVINHQNRADKNWYEQTMTALDAAGIVPENYAGESRRALSASLYSEIIVIAAMSHSIHVDFLTMGRDVPPLPSLEEMLNESPAPSMLDMTTLLKKGRSIRYDEAQGFAPFILYGDLNLSAAYKIFPTEMSKDLRSSTDTKSPLMGACFSPHDAALASEMVRESLYDLHRYVFDSTGRLDAKRHCSDQFDRYDKETVAVALAASYNCDF